MIKKMIIIAAIVFTMASSIAAEEISVIYTDVITAADSATIRTNITYSPWVNMGSGRFFSYGFEVGPYSNDTNWVDDSLIVELQMKFIGSRTMITLVADTVLDAMDSSANGNVIIDADATVLPMLGRLKVTHWDSIAVGEADSALVASATYEKLIRFLFNWR